MVLWKRYPAWKATVQKVVLTVKKGTFSRNEDIRGSIEAVAYCLTSGTLFTLLLFKACALLLQLSVSYETNPDYTFLQTVSQCSLTVE